MTGHGQHGVAEAISEMRTKRLGCTTARLADLLGVDASDVEAWEAGDVQPSPMALMAIGRVDYKSKLTWYERAGQHYADVERISDYYKEIRGDLSGRNQPVQIFGSVGAGPNRFPPERAEETLMLPKAWFRAEQQIVGLRVEGDSMAPLIGDGFFVFVDVRDNIDVRKLDGKIVAAADEHGVCIKWLKLHGSELFLISQNLNGSYPPIHFESNGYRIIGRVVKWVGQHPSSRPL